MRSLVLIGGGGHASDVLQAIEALNAERASIEVLGLLDDGDVDLRRLAGRDVSHLGPLDRLAEFDADHVLCAGWPWTRRALLERIDDAGRASAPIVHPSADVGAGVQLGDGTVVLGGAHLSPMVRLGAHGLVSYNATVGHNTVFGDLAAVMPGAHVSGDGGGGGEGGGWAAPAP
jgi:hypothetical protein